MSNPYVPVFIPASVTPAGVTVDFSSVGRMGAISIYNAGPDPIFFSLDSVPASAAIQNGVRRLLIGETWNVEDTTFLTVSLITAGGQAAVAQIDGWQRAGGAGGSGFGG